MGSKIDYSIRELGSTRIWLRNDLVFSPRTSGSSTYYLLEDPINSKFYRLGQVEYTFVSLLDGRTTISEALQRLSAALPTHGLTEHEAAAISQWLVNSNLGHAGQSPNAETLASAAGQADWRKVRERWNPLVFKLPFGSPDCVFDTITPWLSWLYSPLAQLGWCIVVFTALAKVLTNWGRFAAASEGILAPLNWLWLAACWLVLKFVHEVSHGIVCKRYGGVVRECGVILILFAPLAYVDVTSSWRFRSKWQRIQTAAAGMYAELAIAGLAAMYWSSTTSAYVSHLCFNVIVMASLTTIVFNANPLMRFDGYYMLSDFLGIPNLAANGQQYLRYFARRYFLGLPAALPPWLPWLSGVIKVFGVASLAWRVLVYAGLIAAASTLLHGAGIMLAYLAVIGWFGIPTIRFTKYLIYGKPGERPNRLRFALTAGLAVSVAAFVLFIVPWPGAVQAPAIVEYSPNAVVRTSSPGFVEEVRVHGGAMVEAGTVLLVLRNENLLREWNDLQLALQQSELKGRVLEQQGKMAAYQAEMKSREALMERLAEKQSEVDQLTIRAPSTGTVIGRNLANLVGTHLNTGDEILAIGDRDRKELHLSISQDDVDVFASCIGQPVRVRLPGEPIFLSELKQVKPRADLRPTHLAFGAVNGGPLAVTRVEGDLTESRLETNQYTYLSPRFTGIVRLNSIQSRQLSTGQLGSVSHRAYDEAVATHLYRVFTRWFQQIVRRHSARRTAPSQV